MKCVGITGYIGAGKSFVGEILRERGLPVLDADTQIHELYRDCTELRAKLAKAFGENCLTESGVDRKFFADLIFTDESARVRLESLVYPWLIRSVDEFLVGNFKGVDCAPADSALKETRFVEAALFSRVPEIVTKLDEVWIVSAPEEIRLNRLLARGLIEEDARRRIEKQRDSISPAAFPGKLVRVLENADGKDSLVSQIDQMLRL